MSQGASDVLDGWEREQARNGAGQPSLQMQQPRGGDGEEQRGSEHKEAGGASSSVATPVRSSNGTGSRRPVARGAAW